VASGKSAEVTGLLKAWSGGDQAALDRLTTLVHAELHRIARRYMRNERPDHTLQATALVNEVYLRLVDVKNVDWQHRAQFFAISAQIMRNVLVDAARARGANKRGGAAVKIEVDDAAILAADRPLHSGARRSPNRLFPDCAAPGEAGGAGYFGGMSEEETAEVLKSSPRTVRRDWQFAKAWLQQELRSA
jgi:RNA polymerase sigma factor (TIGR02999 family)